MPSGYVARHYVRFPLPVRLADNTAGVGVPTQDHGGTAGPEELAGFETDVPTGFVLAGAAGACLTSHGTFGALGRVPWIMGRGCVARC